MGTPCDLHAKAILRGTDSNLAVPQMIRYHKEAGSDVRRLEMVQKSLSRLRRMTASKDHSARIEGLIRPSALEILWLDRWG